MGTAVCKLAFEKVRVLGPTVLGVAEVRVSTGVAAAAGVTQAVIVLPTGEVRVILKAAVEAGRRRVSAAGVLAKIEEAIRFPFEVMVRMKAELGQVAGKPVPDNTTLPPLVERVRGAVLARAVVMLSKSPFDSPSGSSLALTVYVPLYTLGRVKFSEVAVAETGVTKVVTPLAALVSTT